MASTIVDCLLKINESCCLVWGLLSSYGNINDNVQMLKVKLQELCSREGDINKELEHAELQQGRKRKREVDNWLRNVQRKKIEVYGIELELRDGGFLTHLKLAGQVKKLTRQVAELVEWSRFPEGLVLCGQERGYALLMKKMVGENFHENVGMIWNWLVNDGVLMIGIYGMGGIGKTSLAMHIHNLILRRVTNFNSVFWVTATQSFSIRKLQIDVAKIVGLNISKEKDEKKRAARLSLALMRRKKCVLILDDVWNHFPLEKVGIPVRVNGLKLILTSRSLQVCRRMGCQKQVKVEPLSDEEAWNLFVDNLGQHTILSPEVTKIARSVARECAGLPLGIITMARNMRGVEDICEWRHALEELRNSEIRIEEMDMEVFHVLRFSYAHLNDKLLQECFLYCALYPEDFEIDREVLIENFVDEGLINGMKSLEATFDEGQTILNKLENICLLGKVENYAGGNKCMRLQDSSSHIAVSMMKRGSQYMAPVKDVEGYYVESQVVKMHDLMRAMAINIIKENCHFMVKAGMQLTEIPDEDEWTEDLEKVSLMWNWIHEISAGTSPRCPNLKTLILKHNESLTWISDSFFVHMSALQVLDLSFTDIEILPNSVSDLATLTSLLLTSCKRLKHLPSLAKLQALIKLDLSYTAITEIPQGLEMLTKLRWLNLYAKDLKMAGRREIAKLTHLQFLILHWWSRKMKVKVEDISGLKKLETFAGNFYDMHHFNAYVHVMQNSGPKNYLLQLDTGECLAEAPQLYFTEVCLSKDVIITGCSIRTGEIPLALPRDIQRLKIERCQDVRSLCDVLSLKNANSLRRCEIADCKGLEFLLSSSSCCTSNRNLESVELYNLKGLRILCKGNEAVPQTMPRQLAFTGLKYFCIYHCPSIKKLLTPGLLVNLQNLEEITVHHCESMREIISVSDSEDAKDIDDEGNDSNQWRMDGSVVNIFTHSKLVSLSLKHLPELRSICRGLMVCESLQKFIIFRCPKLTRLPQTVPPVQTLYDSF